MKIAAELMSDPQTEQNQIERQRAFKTFQRLCHQTFVPVDDRLISQLHPWPRTVSGEQRSIRMLGEKKMGSLRSQPLTTLHHSWSHPFGLGKDSLMIRRFLYLCCGVVKPILTGLWWSTKAVRSCSIWSPEWCAEWTAEIACQRAVAPASAFLIRFWREVCLYTCLVKPCRVSVTSFLYLQKRFRFVSHMNYHLCAFGLCLQKFGKLYMFVAPCVFNNYGFESI